MYVEGGGEGGGTFGRLREWSVYELGLETTVVLVVALFGEKFYLVGQSP